MKVVAFNGSPHTDGVVAAGFSLVKAELEAAGIEFEVVDIGAQNIRGCVDCGGCRKTGKCVFTGDIVNECREKADKADGIILGAPVYYGGIAGNYKCFLDRLFFPGTRLIYKPAAVIVSLRRSGGIAVFHELTNYLTLSGAIIVPTCYWNIIHGNTPEELAEDKEALSIMKVVGKNMVWLLQAIEAGKKSFPFPVHEPRNWTNFVR